jgi:hypothetical protein
MAEITIIFSRAVKVSVPDGELSEEQKVAAINEASNEMDELISKGEFFMSDMDAEIEE